MTLAVGNKELVVMTIIFLVLSVLCRFITGIFMKQLILETENMAATGNRFLQQCKQRFRNCYKLNDGVANIPVFVDKLLGKICIGKFTVEGLSHLSGQFMLLSVLSAGLAGCIQIATGKALSEIVPYYLLCIPGLYIYFSVSGLVDLDGKYQKLKINITDYLENHMAPRLAILDEADETEQERCKADIIKQHPKDEPEIGTTNELEELLEEFFA